MIDEKYIDSDLRDDPGLIVTATEYARNYRGDFEFLRKARQRAIESDDFLPLPIARAVLNCMRNDPRVLVEGTLPAKKPRLRVVRTPEPKPKIKPKQPPRPARVLVNHRLNVTHVYSTHKRAFRAHLIRYSLMYYLPAIHALDLRIKLECSISLSNHTTVATSVIPDGYSECNTCLALYAERIEKEAAAQEEVEREEMQA